MKFIIKPLGLVLLSIVLVACGAGVTKTDDGFLLYEGKTWIAEEGNPITLYILNDSTCGADCDSAAGIEFFRQNITRALSIKEVDVNDALGKDLIADFDPLGVPVFILGDGIKTLERNGEKMYDKIQPVLTEKNNRFLVDGNAIRMKIGKYLKEITFADLDSEPVKGDGPVTVVEFTDFQCPYCKRLHDQTKDAIANLIEEGKITYVVKDFPLSFHAEAKAMHIAANCALKTEGIEAYANTKNFVFDNQQAFGGKGDAGAKAYLIEESAGFGIADQDAFAACVNSGEMDAEIQADVQEGVKFGVSGTPAIFVGNKFIPGAISAEALIQAVNGQ